MALAFGTVGAFASANNASVTPTMPTVAAGDLILINVYVRGGGQPAAPAGYSTAFNVQYTTTTISTQAVFYKIAAGGEGNPTVTVSFGDAGDDVIASIVVVTGADPATPIVQVGATSPNGSAANIGAITGITVQNNNAVVFVGGRRDDWTSVGTLSASGGFTYTEIDDTSVSTVGFDAGMVWDYSINTSGSAAATGNKTFTVTGGSSNPGGGVAFEIGMAYPISEYPLTSGSYAGVGVAKVVGQETSGSGTAASSFTTASITPVANRLQLLAVTSSKATTADIPTVTGCGLTWVEIDHKVYATGSAVSGAVTVFRALGAAPTTGSLTIDFGGSTQISCIWSLQEFSGAKLSGTNGSGAIVQFVDGAGTGTGVTLTLPSFGTNDNVAYGAFVHKANEGTTPGSTGGFSEIHDVQDGLAIGLETEYQNGIGTIDPSWTTSSAYAGIAIEVLPEVPRLASNPTASVTPTANRLQLLAVASFGIGAVPTVTGCGLTWTQVASTAASGTTITLFKALGASPTTGALTISFGGTLQTSVAWSLSEYSGVSTTAPVQQSATNVDTGSTSTLTVTLSAFNNVSNATYGCIAQRVNTTAVTPGSGFTEIHEQGIGVSSLETQWQPINDTSVDWSTLTTSAKAAIAVEIAVFVPQTGVGHLTNIRQAVMRAATR